MATGINLSDALPAGAQFIALDSSSGLNVSGGTASVFVGALAPGDSVQAFVSIKSTVAGDITNTATVSLIQTDSNPANNTFALVTHILPGVSVTVLSATPNSVNPGDSVNFSVTVVSPAGGQPTGTVTFREGTTDLDTQTLDASGQASMSKSLLSPGVHTITAIYSGDSNFAPSSMPIDVTVSGAPADSADLSLDANASPDSDPGRADR